MPEQCVMAAPETEEPLPAGEHEVHEIPVLGRDAIVRVNDVRIQRLEVPEWGGAVHLRVIPNDEYEPFEESLQIRDGRTQNMKAFRARFAALVLCDSDGHPLFADKDIPLLNRKSRVALDRVLEAGMQLNAVRDEDVEGLVGNSESDLSGNSGSSLR